MNLALNLHKTYKNHIQNATQFKPIINPSGTYEVLNWMQGYKPDCGLNLGCSLLSKVLFVVQYNYHEDRVEQLTLNMGLVPTD